MKQPFETAREVSEHLLDLTGKAMLGGDAEAFVALFLLPQEIQTFEGRRLMTTQDDLLRVFNAVRAYHAKIGVSDMVRHCVEATFLDPITVVAMHETRLICGNIIAQTPFPTLSTLKFNGKIWQVAGTSYAIDDCKELNAALLSGGIAQPNHRS